MRAEQQKLCPMDKTPIFPVETNKANSLNLQELGLKKVNLHKKQRLNKIENRSLINQILNKLSIEEQEILKTIMYYDKLTGIKNRNTFNYEVIQEVNKAITLNYSLCFILADIDDFKKVNDTYGHLQGDMLLKQVSEQIQGSLRQGIDKVYRYGGEEFIIILPNTELKTAYKISERIRKAVYKNTSNTLSLGIAKYSNDLNLSILRTDKALYFSKRNGKNKTSIHNTNIDKSYNNYNNLKVSSNSVKIKHIRQFKDRFFNNQYKGSKKAKNHNKIGVTSIKLNKTRKETL